MATWAGAYTFAAHLCDSGDCRLLQLLICAGSRDICCGTASRAKTSCGPCAPRSAIADLTTRASALRAVAASVCGLSIIDLNTGHQPVSNEDESVWVVFNGEIYNYQELRADLIRRGHRFATNSDTETLVHLYEEKGAEGLALLRGMFAFCIWDSRKRKILLARDRFGKKPLYYAALPGGLYFASELKCLRVAGVPLEEEQEALRLYFQFGYIPDPFTAFRAVRKLMPGCWLEYDMDGGISHGRYWRMPAFTPGAPVRMGEAETCANCGRASMKRCASA